MSKPPIVAKEIQISHNGTIFTIQVTLIEEGTQVPPPSPQPVEMSSLQQQTVITKGKICLMLMKHAENMT
jgi:hypothetical protein